MSLGMPILGERDMAEQRHEAVDDRYYFIASGDRQGTAGAKIVLDINDDER